MVDDVRSPKRHSADTWLLSGSFFFIFLGVGALQQFLIPTISTRARSSDIASAVIFACVYFGGPLFLTVYGYVFQYLRERWCIILGGLTYTLFAISLLLTPRYGVLLATALLWGFGAETLWATGPAQVIRTAHHSRFGSISGTFQSAVYAGQMLGVLLLGLILHGFLDPAQGQVAILVTAIGLSAIGNALTLFLRVKARTRAPAKLSDAVRALQSRAGRYLVLLSVATYLGWGLLLSGFTSLAEDIGQESNLQWIVLPYYAGRLLVAWIAGRISDTVGRERVMLAGFALGAIGLLIAGVYPTVPVITAVSAVLGMQASTVSVSSTAAVGDYFREEERHLVFAGMNACGYLAAGGAMIASQVLRQQFSSFAPALFFFAGFYAACALLAARMRIALAQDRQSCPPLQLP